MGGKPAFSRRLPHHLNVHAEKYGDLFSVKALREVISHRWDGVYQGLLRAGLSLERDRPDHLITGENVPMFNAPGNGTDALGTVPDRHHRGRARIASTTFSFSYPSNLSVDNPLSRKTDSQPSVQTLGPLKEWSTRGARIG